MVERSLAKATALAPVIGNASGAKMAEEALATGQSLLSVAQQKLDGQRAVGENARSVVHDRAGDCGKK
jgi:aspartate ammonia-lyase